MRGAVHWRGWVSAIGSAALLAVLLAAAPAHASRALRLQVTDRYANRVLTSGRIHVRVHTRPGRVRVVARLVRGRGTVAFARPRVVRIGRNHRRTLALRLLPAGSKRLRAALARCARPRIRALGRRGRHMRGSGGRRLLVGRCEHRHGAGLVIPGEGPPSGAGPLFKAGAAVGDFTPPLRAQAPNADAECDPSGTYDGPRKWAFTEPYKDVTHVAPPSPDHPTDPPVVVPPNGHYDAGEPYLDCNHNGRWDGNFLGGGNSSPRFYDGVADPVGSRALVASSGGRTVAVEVTDQEGLFNVYQAEIRAAVEQRLGPGKINGIFISATHDESAPDTLGISGVDSTTSSVNDYFLKWFIDRSAQAIVDAYHAQRPARMRFAETLEPANLRQCWSSYPFVDDQRMPVLQAVGTDGRTIATLASVSQHAETLGFNPDPVERLKVSGDWVHFFRQSLEARFGGVGIEMAGSVGSVETPEVFGALISRTPQREIQESHPAGCRTLFEPSGTRVPEGYGQESRAWGEAMAKAVGDAAAHATPSRSATIWGERADVCVPVTNTVFRAGATIGVFAHRPVYTDGCVQEVPASPTGNSAGTSLRSQVAAFRIGDGEFISLPGEVFPFTYFRSFLGPDDMPKPQYGMPAWPLPHMDAPYRFFDGLGEDMIGYIFPRGNSVGVPGEDNNSIDASGTDRFGCNHSDDAEAASGNAADLLADPLVKLLDRHNGGAETVVRGRYVLPDGATSRDPLGGPVLKCSGPDTTYRRAGPAPAVDVAGQGVVRPAAWMSLSGRPQSTPDRDTRGYFTAAGKRVWIDVFPPLAAP